MNYFIISFISFISMIALIVAIIIKANKDIYTDVKDQATCSTKNSSSDKTCGVWEDNTCTKGTCSKQGCSKCNKKTDYIIIILSILISILFILFIVFTILGFYNKKSTISSSLKKELELVRYI